MTAGSTAIDGWTVSIALPSGTAVTNTWNAGVNGSTATVRFTNVGHNGHVAAGQVTEFGFQGTGTGPGMTSTCTAT